MEEHEKLFKQINASLIPRNDASPNIITDYQLLVTVSTNSQPSSTILIISQLSSFVSATIKTTDRFFGVSTVDLTTD